jgi:2-amino-4-hydroxy-6-hydroxymethyldihydropteridine diphosphokinase
VQSYIALGSNLGQPAENIRTALAAIRDFATVIAVSSFYKTKPWGITNQPHFINAVASIETNLSAEDLLHHLLNIERKMGRERVERWGPRLIDLDILTFGESKIDTPDLTIPHPHMFERAFVLVPLAEIDSSFASAVSLLLANEVAGVEKLVEQTY